MALKWDARTMATGVEEIDAQHQELIKHINEFFSLMHMGKGGDGLDEFMDFLGQYAAWHFKHEEGCMEEYRCPAAAANKRAHQTFIQIFRGYRNRLREEGPTTSLVIEVQQKVSDWVRNHIVHTDTQLAQCVKHAEVG
jgi:hemerythrin